MARGRTGSLSPKTYFPKTGDLLEDHTSKITWQCLRLNSAAFEGVLIKWVILVGKLHDDSLTYLTLVDQESSVCKSFFDTIDVIHRKRSKGTGLITYKKYKGSTTWLQEK